MNFTEAMAALQLVAEEAIGAPNRAAQKREDDKFDRSLDALRREQLERI